MTQPTDTVSRVNANLSIDQLAWSLVDHLRLHLLPHREANLAVKTEPLARIIESWLDAGLEGAYCTKAELTRRTAERGNKVGERTIRKIIDREHPRTKWANADALLTVIDRTEALYNGEVEVVVIDRRCRKDGAPRRAPVRRKRARGTTSSVGHRIGSPRAAAA